MAKPTDNIPNARVPAPGKGLALDPVGLVPGNAMGSGSTGTSASSLFLRADRSWAAPPGSAGVVVIAASNTTYTSGTVTLTGVGGGVTVSSNTGQRIDISVAAQSVQPGVQQLVASNASFSSGTVSISGFGAATVNTAANIIRISVPTQTAETGISGVAASNTTYTSGTFTITGVGGGVTVSSNTGQRVDISVAAPVAQTVQTQNLHNVTVSSGLGGATSGVLAEISSGTMTLEAGANITLSQAGNKINIKGVAAPVAQSAQTQSLIQGVANSQTTYNTGTVYLSEQANITINSSVNGASQYYKFSVAAPGAPATTNSYYRNIPYAANTQTLGVSGSTSYVQPFELVENHSFSYLRFPVTMSAISTSYGTSGGNTAYSASLLSTIFAVVYSLGTGGSSRSLQSVASGSGGITQQWSISQSSTQYTVSFRVTFPSEGSGGSTFSSTQALSSSTINLNTGTLSNFNGMRYLDVPFASSLAKGDYWLGYGISSASGTQGTNAMSGLKLTMSNWAISQVTNSIAIMGSASAASNELQRGLGSFTTNAIGTTASMDLSNISSDASQRMMFFEGIREA